MSHQRKIERRGVAGMQFEKTKEPKGSKTNSKQYKTPKVRNSSPNYVQRETAKSGTMIKC